jgi:uncharacterized protein (DUF2461 family)
MATGETFQGFGREAIGFLAELAANNERAWFQPRKAEYERLLKRPLEVLCAELAVRFAARGIPLLSDPAKSPFRIYRDVRFSRDKTPYKPFVSASFAWVGEGDGAPPDTAIASDGTAPHRGLGRHAGGVGYFHLGPGDVFVGGGMWHPEREVIRAWRTLVVDDSARVHAAIDDPAFVREFSRLDGDRLARVPDGLAADHPDAALLRLKDLTFGRRLSDADALSPGLPDLIADSLAAALPVFRLLAGLAAA